jgi:hypothetical protein
MGDLFTEAGL